MRLSLICSPPMPDLQITSTLRPRFVRQRQDDQGEDANAVDMQGNCELSGFGKLSSRGDNRSSYLLFKRQVTEQPNSSTKFRRHLFAEPLDVFGKGRPARRRNRHSGPGHAGFSQFAVSLYRLGGTAGILRGE